MHSHFPLVDHISTISLSVIQLCPFLLPHPILLGNLLTFVPPYTWIKFLHLISPGESNKSILQAHIAHGSCCCLSQIDWSSHNLNQFSSFYCQLMSISNFTLGDSFPFCKTSSSISIFSYQLCSQWPTFVNMGHIRPQQDIGPVVFFGQFGPYCWASTSYGASGLHGAV